MKKCQLKKRTDDIPKIRPREKSWHCETCGGLLFSDKKPPCMREQVEKAVAQIQAIKQQMHIED